MQDYCSLNKAVNRTSLWRSKSALRTHVLRVDFGPKFGSAGCWSFLALVFGRNRLVMFFFASCA